MRTILARLSHAVRTVRSSRHTHRFFTAFEQRRIVAVIQDAEHQTSGEIRVHVEGHCAGDAYVRARQVFAALGMHRTRQRNGALIYLAIRDRKFAVVGDDGIHAAVPPDFWDAVRDAMADDFRRGRFCAGVCDGVSAIGRHLKTYFPWTPSDRDELPDRVSTGEEG